MKKGALDRLIISEVREARRSHWGMTGSESKGAAIIPGGLDSTVVS